MAATAELYRLAGKRVWIAGHTGMVGAALVRRLAGEGCTVLTVDRGGLDLRCEAAVGAWTKANRPQAVFVAAATTGGIHANDSRPAEFVHDNLAIAGNIVRAAHDAHVEKLMFLASSCVYPKLAEQPMKESDLLGGPLEPTNQWYAVAKIAGIKLCQAYRRQYDRDFISVIPANLYGPGDDFDPESSHVIPALIRKLDEAVRTGGPVEVWGTGSPRREFLFVDDAADALVFLMQCYSEDDVINVGYGDDISIRELTLLVADVVGYRGEFVYATDRPDGMPFKRLDGRRIANMGWSHRTGLREGLEITYRWYRDATGRGSTGRRT